MAVLTDKQRDELSELSPEIARRASDSYNKIRVKSSSICNPGDILFFNYTNTSRIKVGNRAYATRRVVLAVANKKTGTVTYTTDPASKKPKVGLKNRLGKSPRSYKYGKKSKVGPKNKLLTAFTLQGSEEVIARILKKLYKRRDKASYQNIRDSLSALLGRNSYRTYNIANIEGDPISLILEKEKPSNKRIR